MFDRAFDRTTTAERSKSEIGGSPQPRALAQTVLGEEQTSDRNASAVQHCTVPLLVDLHQLRAMATVSTEIRNVHHHGHSFDHIR